MRDPHLTIHLHLVRAALDAADLDTIDYVMDVLRSVLTEPEETGITLSPERPVYRTEPPAENGKRKLVVVVPVPALIEAAALPEEESDGQENPMREPVSEIGALSRGVRPAERGVGSDAQEGIRLSGADTRLPAGEPAAHAAPVSAENAADEAGVSVTGGEDDAMQQARRYCHNQWANNRAVKLADIQAITGWTQQRANRALIDLHEELHPRRNGSPQSAIRAAQEAIAAEVYGGGPEAVKASTGPHICQNPDCGKPIERREGEQSGNFKKRQYCPGCAPAGGRRGPYTKKVEAVAA